MDGRLELTEKLTGAEGGDEELCFNANQVSLSGKHHKCGWGGGVIPLEAKIDRSPPHTEGLTY